MDANSDASAACQYPRKLAPVTATVVNVAGERLRLSAFDCACACSAGSVIAVLAPCTTSWPRPSAASSSSSSSSSSSLSASWPLPTTVDTVDNEGLGDGGDTEASATTVLAFFARFVTSRPA